MLAWERHSTVCPHGLIRTSMGLSQRRQSSSSSGWTEDTVCGMGVSVGVVSGMGVSVGMAVGTVLGMGVTADICVVVGVASLWGDPLLFPSTCLEQQKKTYLKHSIQVAQVCTAQERNIGARNSKTKGSLKKVVESSL